ncbi:MAG: hypothetical protein PHX43_01635, partial [Alphaproteobacteria bacterium]|nr:hypothetical protein [Alphaproteobacteria bacterium]
ANPENPADPNDNQQRRRRRGRRGGRRRNGGNEQREGNGDRWERRPRNQDQQGSAPNIAEGNIPTSIHEIDTTPRYPTGESRHNNAPRPESHSASTSSGHVTHEVVNPPVDNPKGGWWRRLTGQ